MRVVIQCAARKNPAAGSLTGPGGRPVLYVARPDEAPADARFAYARPDDTQDDGSSWRARVLTNSADGNPLGLLPAWRLYAHDVYRALVDRFGVDRVFILSAGWGLIPADFPTPLYDITFTAQAESWKRRRRGDVYDDFRLIADDGDDMIFLGGRDYLPLFTRLTEGLAGSRTVFFNTARLDLPPGFTAVRYQTSTRTNWHYECARDLVAGRLDVLPR